MLNLNGTQIDDVGIYEFGFALGNAALPRLESFDLYENPIRDRGMQNFAAFIESGGLQALTNFCFDFEKISETAAPRIKEIFKKRNISGSAERL